MPSPALVVTGASGLVGRALALVEPITPLPRGAGSGLRWDPVAGTVQDDARPIGAVVHLAGEPVAEGRWTDARKRVLLDSRVAGTRTLVDWLKGRAQRPEVLVSASGVGYYGDRGDELLDEGAGPGAGFLAEICQGWEREALAAEAAGIRVVVLRIGVVLSKQGGALEKMKLPFSLGLGGPLGSGQQWFPWIHLDDLVGVIRAALRDTRMRGVYNAVAPGLVRQRDFARAYGVALGRPAVLPTPAFALKAAMGQMAEEALLSGQRARPAKLEALGYPYQHPEVGAALKQIVG